MIKRIGAVALGLLSMSVGVNAQGANVYVNGQKLGSEAYIINDRVYVPHRDVGESMGTQVEWDNETRRQREHLSHGIYSQV